MLHHEKKTLRKTKFEVLEFENLENIHLASKRLIGNHLQCSLLCKALLKVQDEFGEAAKQSDSVFEGQVRK